MEHIAHNDWDKNARLACGEADLIATLDVGPRILRFGFRGERNLLAEIAGQQGGRGEADWMIRGGHRLWAAPESKPETYEPDNDPVRAEPLHGGGVRLTPPVGKLTGLQKIMELVPLPAQNGVEVRHALLNRSDRAIAVAPWALTVMAPGGTAVVPLPAKIPHTERLTHNQEWSLWAYTDLTDPRLALGSRFVLLRHDPARGPVKIGMAHREGWAAYAQDGAVFVKRFERLDGAVYPDGNVNFEMFANEDFLELESLGPLTELQPGQSVAHRETWSLARTDRTILTEADAAHWTETSL